MSARRQKARSIDAFLCPGASGETPARWIGTAVLCICLWVDTRTITNHLAWLTFVCAHALGADLIGAALGVNRSTCIMSVLFTYRLLVAIGVDDTGEVIASGTFVGITLFVDAASAFPPPSFCAIVRMRAAMVLVVWSTLICKDMLIRLAFDFW